MAFEEHERIKILFFHHGGTIGGAPLSLLYLIQNLNKSKFEPHVVFTQSGPVVKLFEESAIGYEICPISLFHHHTLYWLKGLPGLKDFIFFGIKFFPDFFRLRQIIRKHDPDIIHLNSSTLIIAGLAAYSLKHQVVWHVREVLHDGYFKVRKRIIQFIINRCSTQIIAISKTAASRLPETPKLNVVYNGVSLEYFDRKICSSLKKELLIGNGYSLIGMIGQIYRAKGVFQFVQAARILVGKGVRAKFILVGDAPILEDHQSRIKNSIRKWLGIKYNDLLELKKMVHQYGIENDVIFLGNRTDVPNILAGLDMVVFLSGVDAFGRPIIEAGAMGKPVIALNKGSCQELVKDNVTGILLKSDEPEVVADAILGLILDPERAKKLGEAGYQMARSKFTIEKHLDAICGIYLRLAESL
ncbi:hypothetical protein HKBW3C_00325 [Candidatus Hakubella thermalkaliphila]|nr:hypothetical protein HKBW3C_00325 [Candidatus Hakubella thermalkaliphila]